MYIETQEYKGCSFDIFHDEDPMNPRTEWDNLGKMICFHKRYDLGDQHDYRSENYNSFDELYEEIEQDYPDAVILPIYMYDHSGLTINTTGFHCEWDSGQIGWILMERKVGRENWPDAEDLDQKIRDCLISEVETYDQYLRGDVYGFILDKDTEDEESCGGFFGMDYLIEEVHSIIDARSK